MPSPWLQDATDRLSEAGYRSGGARAAVIAALDEQACAVSAVQLEDILRGRGRRTVARASVYRILEELVRLRVVTRVDVGQGVARYEAARADGHHHHLVCDTCGDVAPFEDDALERTIDRLADRVDFDVAEHEIVLHGSCAGCRS